LSSSEAAAVLGVCERTLRRYIACGRIRYHRLPGGHYRIPVEAIDEFWAQNTRAKEQRRSERAHAPRRASSRPDPITTARRRIALGSGRDGDYDLSPEHLAELRARFATTRAT
jgi:excisionase family DNA binding protein